MSLQMMRLEVLLLLIGLFGRLFVSADEKGQSTVVIVSADGVRADYMERAETPFLDRLMAHGAQRGVLVPTFPSNTFQSHASLATGVTTAVHGVPGNSFYDTRSKVVYRYPSDAALLEAEPIWLTAERQGVRSIVMDWVLSHNQEGMVRSSYYDEAYARSLSDSERLERVLKTWRDDTDDNSIRLVLAYTESPDREGHRFGPESREVELAMTTLDGQLEVFHNGALEIWKRTAQANDVFYFMLLSDHGMADVHTLVNLRKAAGLEKDDDVIAVTTGDLGHIFFDAVEDVERRSEWLTKTERTLKAHAFLTVYRKDNLPPAWGFFHEFRVGDLVVIADNGYAFSSRPASVTADSRSLDGPLGMHGAHPDDNPAMHSMILVHRVPSNGSSGDLGVVSALQIHTTIAHLLEIEPAPMATAEPFIKRVPGPSQ